MTYLWRCWASSAGFDKQPTLYCGSLSYALSRCQMEVVIQLCYSICLRSSRTLCSASLLTATASPDLSFGSSSPGSFCSSGKPCLCSCLLSQLGLHPLVLTCCSGVQHLRFRSFWPSCCLCCQCRLFFWRKMVFSSCFIYFLSSLSSLYS